MKQQLTGLKGEIDKSIILLGECNTFQWLIEEDTHTQISKNVENFSSAIEQLDYLTFTEHYTEQHNIQSSQAQVERSIR